MRASGLYNRGQVGLTDQLPNNSPQCYTVQHTATAAWTWLPTTTQCSIRAAPLNLTSTHMFTSPRSVQTNSKCALPPLHCYLRHIRKRRLAFPLLTRPTVIIISLQFPHLPRARSPSCLPCTRRRCTRSLAPTPRPQTTPATPAHHGTTSSTARRATTPVSTMRTTKV